MKFVFSVMIPDYFIIGYSGKKEWFKCGSHPHRSFVLWKLGFSDKQLLLFA
jgi:hypothetical protein